MARFPHSVRGRFFGGVRLITLRRLRLFLVAVMIIKTIAEGDALPRGNGEVAGALGFLFEIVQAKRVGREEAVIADVPSGRMARVAGVIKNGEAEYFRAVGASSNRTVIVAPIGLFA